MKKMVFAVPAENGGALSNLLEVYKEASLDTLNQWVFVVSLSNIESKKNIQVLYYPSVKHSWINRIWFDLFTYSKLIEKYKPDIVYNQQSFIKKKGAKEIYFFYATNVLFFSEIHLSPLRHFSLWVRKNLLKPTEVYSIKAADKVIVESIWFRDLLCEKYHLTEEKFLIKKIKTNVRRRIDFHMSHPCSFFYPASGLFYKNHLTILRASKILVDNGVDFSITFTLTGNENDYVKRLKKFSEYNHLPIKWVGQLSIQEMEKYYETSVLIFPSTLESAGLPLYEAKEMGAPVLCSDMIFSRSAMRGYTNVSFFNAYDYKMLSTYMKQFCNEY